MASPNSAGVRLRMNASARPNRLGNLNEFRQFEKGQSWAGTLSPTLLKLPKQWLAGCSSGQSWNVFLQSIVGMGATCLSGLVGGAMNYWPSLSWRWNNVASFDSCFCFVRPCRQLFDMPCPSLAHALTLCAAAVNLADGRMDNLKVRRPVSQMITAWMR